MKRGLGLLALACATFGAALADATVLEPAPVNDAAIMGSGFPKSLSEYAFFQDGRRQDPGARVHPYALNTPLWSDGAEKLRFIYLPAGTQLAADGEGLLRFPVGAAIIKTFAFGEGAERRLIETRVLLHRAEGWVALPYRWNIEQTDATLALAGGRVDLTTPAGEAISYAIPNKNQCKTCHSKDGAVIPIGPKARNLSADWLGDMSAKGVLAGDIAGGNRLPDWRTHATGPAAPLARAYLDVNCAHCHQPGGGASNSGLDLRWEQQDAHAIGIAKRPVAAGRGAGGHDFSVVPGAPDASILLYRMDSAEPGIAMPELGKSSVDKDGVAVVRRWIAEMK
ncbi:MAG: SO2930 family diheme c-type cytochrome [Erythrobacter sp.]|uniref:SO2930 family diheme c-type cytochrome n=1 Tax=Erythrobacter sp. TaxID=1042 RepID=UPI002B497C63|nr:SO2930 family diheme c-type cytochrome [Erythrobacter sp.]WRH70445.1 MAG: SO2930 family diheme c-type cytochrome [Erythrobacter sp.]